MSSATATAAVTGTAAPLTFQRSPALPHNCTFDSHDWEILSRYWHPVAFAADVTDKPISVTLLDEPLVVFRSNGQPVSARDICPHRGAPLSQGWVDNGRIVCPYHGLAYGSDGKCKHIPSQTDGPIDPASTPLARLLPQDVGEIFASALDDGGIRFHPGRSVDRIDRLSDGYRLTFAEGEPIVADLVVSAVGLVPRTALAAAAGLEIDQGIRTDAWCRTSAPDIYALGDCAAIDGKVQPYVLPIMHAARALARTLAGQPTRVAFPVMPIIVKTPASPAVVVTPEGEGAWSIETAGDAAKHAARAVCRHATRERPLGFALLGAAIEGKAALIKAMTEGH